LTIPVREGFLAAAVSFENREFIETAAILFDRFAKKTGRFREMLEFAKRRGTLIGKVNELIGANFENELAICEICEWVDCQTAISVLESAIRRMPASTRIAQLLMDSYIASKELCKAHDFALSNLPLIESCPVLSITLARINEKFGGDPAFLEKCIQRFPTVPTFWLFCAGSAGDSLSVLKSAVAQCPQSADVHVALISAAVRQNFPRPRIRALLERARQACPQDAIVWLISAEFEEKFRRSAILEQAKSAVTSEIGLVWARQVELVEGEGRHSAAKQALETVGNCRELVLVMAVCLWRSGSLDQARAALENANREFPDWGDGWAFRLKFERDQGTQGEERPAGKLKSGFLWTRMSSDARNYGLDQDELLQKMEQLIGDPMVTDVSIFGDYLTLL
jgi:pre-mRNA-processing factor 6